MQDLQDQDREFQRWIKDTHNVKSMWSNMMKTDFTHANSDVLACPLSIGQRYEILRCRLYVDIADRLQSVYSFPFLLSPANKATLMQLEGRVEQRMQERQEIQLARRRGQEFIATKAVLGNERRRGNASLTTLGTV